MLPSSVNVFAAGCFSLTVMWSPARSAMPSTGRGIAVVHPRVDLEAVALAGGVLPGGRAQIAERQLALAAVELRDLAEFGGVALAGAAGEIVEDAAARAVDRVRAARLHQAEFIERLMREKRPAGRGLRCSAGKPRSGGGSGDRQQHQARGRNPERVGPCVFSLSDEIRHNSDGPIAPQLGPFHEKVRIARPNAMFFGIVPTFATIACRPARLHVTGTDARNNAPGRVDDQALGQFKRGRNMAGTVEQKLAAQGVTLARARAPRWRITSASSAPATCCSCPARFASTPKAS